MLTYELSKVPRFLLLACQPKKLAWSVSRVHMLKTPDAEYYPQEPPYVPTVLPTVGTMECCLDGLFRSRSAATWDAFSKGFYARSF